MSQSHLLPFHSFNSNTNQNSSLPMPTKEATLPVSLPIALSPTPEVSSSPVPATRPPQMVARWQMIDGKLICRWFQCPD